MGVDGSGWEWVGVDGSGWEWVGVGGSGWEWVGVDGSGWEHCLVMSFSIYIYISTTLFYFVLFNFFVLIEKCFSYVFCDLLSVFIFAFYEINFTRKCNCGT